MAEQQRRPQTAKVNPPPPLNVTRGAAEWKMFKQMWNNYVIVARLENEDEGYMKALFLHTLGVDGLSVYNGLEIAEAANVPAIIDALDTHFIGQTNETYERFVFNKRDQREGESIEEYVNALRKLTKTCNFSEAMTSSLLRDRIILGIKSQSTRESLLQIANLDLQTCIDKCRAAESTNVQIKAMKDDVDVGQAHAVHKFKKGGRAKEKGHSERNCKYCGKTHEMKKEECPAWGRKCSACGKSNHFAKMCLQKKKEMKRVHAVNREDEEDEYLLAVEKKRNNKIIKAVMMIEGKKIICQVDSGASVNVISAKHVEKKQLKPTKTALHVYNGDTIKAVGKADLQITNPKTKQNWGAEFIVVEEELTTLIGKTTSESMKLITVHYNNMSVAQIRESTDIFSSYSDVFAEEQGSLPGEAHLQVDETITPTISASGRIPLAMKKRVKEELDRLQEAEIIDKIEEPTSWCSRMVVATKRSGKLRLCIDPRPLNKALKRELYPIPTMDDVLPQLAKSRYFSKLDLSSAYWHVHLDEESSKLTTFQTPYGRYRWKRLPFGTSVSSELFQKRLDQALEGLEGVIGISDDIVVHGETEEEHDRNLIALLERCRKVGIHLNKEKTELKKKSIAFLGHLVTSEGLKIDPEKLEAVKKMPKPEDVEGVRRFCGFVNYLAKFLPKLSEVLEPIRQLTRDDVPWMWTAVQDQAFATVQELVTKAPVLAFYNPAEELQIQCDASKSGLGAVLLQQGRPIAYCSRALTKTEQNYAQIEKELLAIVFSVERWHQFTFGRQVSVQTDHKPLETIFQKPLASAPRRLQGMMLKLQGYDLSIGYRRGKDMVLADTLSRAYLPDKPSEQLDIEDVNSLDFILIRKERLDELKEATSQDEILQKLKSVIMDGWPEDKSSLPMELTSYFSFRDELSVQDGLIIKQDRVVVPHTMRSQMKKLLHSTHSGIDACLKRARECLYWPGMTGDISQFIAGCEICQRFQASNPPETLQPHELPSRQWEKIGVDLFELDGKDYLVTVDYLSNFWEIDRLDDTRATTVIKALKAHFARYGLPCTVISDNGPQFTSENFKRFASTFDFEHITSSPYHSKSNGKAESAVKTAKSILRKNKDGDQYLALLNYRNTPSQDSNTSPSQKFFNRRTRTLLPMQGHLLNPKITLKKDIRKIKEKKTVTKARYDQRARDLRPLHEGDTVIMKPHAMGRKEWTRGTVINDNGGRSYEIETSEGNVFRRNRVHLKKVPPQTQQQDAETQERENQRCESQPSIETPKTPETDTTPRVNESPVKSPPRDVRTRSGRLVKRNRQQDYIY